MIELTIPGQGTIQLEHLVCDVNGTLAVDGKLIDGVARGLSGLRDRLQLHLLTADTHGQQDRIDRQLGLQAVRVPPGHEAETKAAYVRDLGESRVVAFGQGANDAAMLRQARIGVAVLSAEGAAAETLTAADLVVPDILSALALLDHPMRIIASLRR
ncbi:MAG TPA: HAD family hydrolase [Anaerolineales bacterium]|nr:HAD family hydrolase [Anaerolineales bacterium]